MNFKQFICYFIHLITKIAHGQGSFDDTLLALDILDYLNDITSLYPVENVGDTYLKQSLMENSPYFSKPKSHRIQTIFNLSSYSTAAWDLLDIDDIWKAWQLNDQDNLHNFVSTIVSNLKLFSEEELAYFQSTASKEKSAVIVNFSNEDLPVLKETALGEPLASTYSACHICYDILLQFYLSPPKNAHSYFTRHPGFCKIKETIFNPIHPETKDTLLHYYARENDEESKAKLFFLLKTQIINPNTVNTTGETFLDILLSLEDLELDFIKNILKLKPPRIDLSHQYNGQTLFDRLRDCNAFEEEKLTFNINPLSSSSFPSITQTSMSITWEYLREELKKENAFDSIGVLFCNLSAKLNHTINDKDNSLAEEIYQSIYQLAYDSLSKINEILEKETLSKDRLITIIQSFLSCINMLFALEKKYEFTKLSTLLTEVLIKYIGSNALFEKIPLSITGEIFALFSRLYLDTMANNKLKECHFSFEQFITTLLNQAFPRVENTLIDALQNGDMLRLNDILALLQALHLNRLSYTDKTLEETFKKLSNIILEHLRDWLNKDIQNLEALTTEGHIFKKLFLCCATHTETASSALTFLDSLIERLKNEYTPSESNDNLIAKLKNLQEYITNTYTKTDEFESIFYSYMTNSLSEINELLQPSQQLIQLSFPVRKILYQSMQNAYEAQNFSLFTLLKNYLFPPVPENPHPKKRPFNNTSSSAFFQDESAAIKKKKIEDETASHFKKEIMPYFTDEIQNSMALSALLYTKYKDALINTIAIKDTFHDLCIDYYPTSHEAINETLLDFVMSIGFSEENNKMTSEFYQELLQKMHENFESKKPKVEKPPSPGD